MTSRRGFLAGALATLAAAVRSRPANAAEDRFLLVYWVKGGWDPTFCFDPHFDSASVEGDATSEPGTANGIPFADAESRPSVRQFFLDWGAQTAVINGLAVGSISHDAGTRLLLTGQRDQSGEDLPTRIAAATGSALTLPHAVVAGPSYPGAHGGLVTQFDDTLLGAARGEVPSPRDLSRDERIRAWLDVEAASGTDPQLVAWRAAAARLPALRDFATTTRPGLSDEFARIDLIARLFSLGLSRTAIVTGAVPPMSQWDSHVENQLWQDRCYEGLFANLRSLCTTLQGTPDRSGAPLLASTRILVLSEMGRQPTFNAQGGKDHWPTTSAMLIGADVAGGRTYGGTDDGLVARGLDRSTGEASDDADRFDPGALAATLALGFDVDPAELAPGSTALTAIWS